MEKLKANISSLRKVSASASAKKYLEEIERLIKKAKKLINEASKMNEEVSTPQDHKQVMLATRQLEEDLEYVSGMRLLIKITEGSDSPSSLFEKMGELFIWLGLESPQIRLETKEEVIDEEKWAVITIEGGKCQPWDDLSLNIRRRHRGLRDIITGAGGRYYYEVVPEKGTKIVIMLPAHLSNN